MSIDEKRAQVIAQCKVVAHFARVLAEVHTDLIKFYEHPNSPEGILDIGGNRTARLMEMLGNTINGMDANEEGDEWTDPIFEAAHAMFPQSASTPT